VRLKPAASRSVQRPEPPRRTPKPSRSTRELRFSCSFSPLATPAPRILRVPAPDSIGAIFCYLVSIPRFVARQSGSGAGVALLPLLLPQAHALGGAALTVEAHAAGLVNGTPADGGWRRCDPHCIESQNASLRLRISAKTSTSVAPGIARVLLISPAPGRRNGLVRFSSPMVDGIVG